MNVCDLKWSDQYTNTIATAIMSMSSQAYTMLKGNPCINISQPTLSLNKPYATNHNTRGMKRNLVNMEGIYS